MKIAFCEFHQETNSFNPILTTLDGYKQGGLYEGEDIITHLKGKPKEADGMIRAIEEVGGEIVPILSMYSQSGGTVKQEVVDFFLGKVIPAIKAAMPLDGVFVGLHGATQSTGSDDVCGDILRAIRETVGPDCVIAASTDLHANVTEVMVRNADFISGYQTYPHSDFSNTGYRAAKLGLAKIMKTADYKMAWASIPMIAPASSYTTLHGAFKEVEDYALSLIQSGELADCSVYQMQPWLDVNPGFTSVLTIAEDEQKALACANEIAKRLFNARHAFVQKLSTIEEVVSEAEKNFTGKPYVLVDSSDSPNAGATGDSAAVIGTIMEMNSDVKAGIYLNDDAAVAKAFELGVGGTGTFTIGSTLDQAYAKPVTLEARVVSLHDGIYMEEGVQRGNIRNVGLTAVLHARNMDILVCHNVFAPGDPQMYRHFGIEPLFYQLVSVKACTSWRAAYEPMAAKAFETDTPGDASLNLMRLNYTHLPKTHFPFSEITEADIRKAEIVTK